MKINRTKAFTIVEILVVVTVVAILSSLAIFTYESIKKDSRDATRNSNATIISEALEKYYEKNGEYPSVASLSNSTPGNTGASVASKLSIPVSSLTMPNLPSTTTNPITSNPDTPGDYIAYIAQSADNNTQCQTDVNGGCDEYTLQYLEEATGEPKAIESRRRSRVVSVKPDLEVSVINTSSIGASWSAVADATSYELQRSLTNDFSAPATTSHSSTTGTASGLLPDTEYFFRVRAVLPDRFSDWSDTQSDTTSSLGAPTGTITITATLTSGVARGTAGGGTCPSGTTIERQIRYQINANAWVAYTTGTPRDVAATEGYKYSFQAQARCKTGTSNGPWAQSTTVAVIAPVTAPSGLTITAAMSGTNARGTAGGGSCATGTTIERQVRYQINANAWVAYTTGTPRDVAATIGYRYTFQQQARCVGTNVSSGWTASSTAAVVRPISTPAAPGLTVSTSGSTTTWTASGSCPAGTTISYQRRSLQQGGSWTGWEGTSSSGVSTWNTSAQGYTYSRMARIQCSSSYATSAWSAQSATVSYTRPITVPQATGWTHVSLGWQNEANCKYYNGCKWRRYNWTPPTCPAGTSYYSSRWNSYVGSKMSWDNGRSSIYRWWEGNSQTSTTSDSVAYSSAQNSHIVEYSSNVPANFDDVKHKLIWTCRNGVTGVTGTMEMYSPTFRYM